MKINLEIGLQMQKDYIVNQEDSAINHHSGEVEVLATPRLLAMMEETSYLSVKPFMPEGYVTVGMDMHVFHIKASKPGSHITIKSVLTKQEDRKIYFDVLAYEGQMKIGQAECVRFIVNKERFLSKL